MFWSNVRAEQLVLGAVLSGQPLPAEAAQLRASDFFYPVGQQLYSDISRLRAEHPQWGFSTLAGQIAPGYLDAMVSAELLCRMALRSADTNPDHVEVAVKMVLRYGAEEGIARETDLIGATLRGQENPLPQRAQAYIRLGEAITRRTVDLRDLDHHIDGEDAMLDAWHDARTDIARPDWDSMSTDARRDRQQQERTILAGMIAYPGIRWAICEWLPDETFATYARRNIYRALTDTFDHQASGTFIDEVHRGLSYLRKSGWNETPPEGYKPSTDYYELDRITEIRTTACESAAAAQEIFALGTAAHLAAEQQRRQQQAPPGEAFEPPLQPPSNPGTGPSAQPKP